jgi:hypothetical protein
MRRVGTWTGAALAIEVPVAQIDPTSAGGCAVLVQLGETGRIVGAKTVAVAAKSN